MIQVHPSAIVDTTDIGSETRIWAFVHILKGVSIGKNCNICDHCFIEQGVKLGNNVTVKSGIYIWEGVEIEDDVFLGPNVVFTNDLRPRSKKYVAPLKTIIRKGASIGANSTIIAGVEIGQYSMVGAGSVVTRDVSPYSLVYGNPAKHRSWIDEEGNKLVEKENNKWESIQGKIFVETSKGLMPS